MNTPVPTMEERHNIEVGTCFTSDQNPLSTAIVACARMRRRANGTSLSSPGATARQSFERPGAVRLEPTRLVVLSRHQLLAIAER